MKTLYIFIAILCFSLLFNCKKENTLSEYKFSDQEMVLNCKGEDTKLLNEALYTFENDIKIYYSNRYNPDGKINLVYSEFLSRNISGIIPFNDIVSPHTLKVFKLLKTKTDLWDMDNSQSKLNYYGSFFSCIAENVQDKNLKTTLNALLTTKSMSPRIFVDPLASHSNIISNDNYLRAYVAFDLFYAKLFDIDEAKIKERPKINYY